MQRIFDIKSSQTQALCGLAIDTNINPPIERFFDRFYNRLFGFNQLKRWEPWLHLSCCWAIHKNGILRVNKSHYQGSGPSKSHSQYDNMTLRFFQLYYHQLKIVIYFKILVFALLFLWYQVAALHHILSLN